MEENMALPKPTRGFFGYKKADIELLYNEYLDILEETHVQQAMIAKLELLLKSAGQFPKADQDVQPNKTNISPTSSRVQNITESDTGINPMMAAAAGYMIANSFNSSPSQAGEGSHYSRSTNCDYSSSDSGSCDSGGGGGGPD